MWKKRPVVATPVGGITTQIIHAKNGFLPETAEGCAEHIVQLVREPRLASALGRTARQTVRERFLLPRLLEDDLRIFGELANGVASDRVTA